MTLLTKISYSLANLGTFWHVKFNAQIFRWNLVFIIVQFAFLLFRFDRLPPQVPLFYSQPWGETQLASPNWLFVLPIFSLSVWILNTLLSAVYLSKIQLLSRLLIIFSLVLSILSAIGLYQIISLVS